MWQPEFLWFFRHYSCVGPDGGRGPQMYNAYRPLCLLPPAGFSSWERFLAEHRWSLPAVTARLVTLVVAKLGNQLQVHGASLLGKDTTLVAKTATRMVGVQKWKAHSDNADRGAYLVGHHWNLVGLISPWGTRWLCWPLVVRLVPGLKVRGNGSSETPSSP